MGEKAYGDKPVVVAPQFFNRVVDLVNARKPRELTDQGRPVSSPLDRTILSLRNDSGASLSRGSLLEIGDMYLGFGTSRPFSPLHPWFEGLDFDGGYWAITTEPLPTGDVGECQIAGVCIVRVNVTNLDHRRAFPKIGQSYCESSHLGPLEILQMTDTSNTGVQECWCILRSPQGTVRGIAVDALSHGSAGTVNLVKLRSGTHSYQRNGSSAHLTVEARAYALNTADTIAVGTAVILTMDEAGNINADNANCDVRDWELSDEDE